MLHVTAQTDVMAAEQSTLGGMMLKRSVCEDVMETLYASDFHAPRHEVIYETIVRLFNGGHPTDTVAVADALITAGLLQQAGGADYLHTLTSVVPVAVQAPYYAAIVHDAAVLRRMGELGATMQQWAERGGDPTTMVETARAKMDDVLGMRKQSLVYVGDLIDEIVADAERPRRVYPSPWSSLDPTLGGGFRPGALYVLAARPGIGKTAVALQIATALADAGPVSFSSLEMPREELVRRIIAQGAEMPHHLLEAGRPMPEYFKAKIEEWQLSAPHAVAIDDRGTVTVGDVRAHARAVKRPAGKLAGVVVDYLQLMGGPTGVNRQEVVAENARQMKLMARELDCPVILLSQLNRDPEKRMDKRPQLSDLRESGAIEQDADVVMMLYRDPDFEQAGASEVPLPIPLELAVAKNRHGAPMTHTLMWEGSQMRAFDR